MTKRTSKHVALSLLIAAVAFGCDEEDPGTDGGPDPDVDSGTMMMDEDAGTMGEDAGGGGDTPTCEAYCDTIMMTCTGANSLYADREDCLLICESAGWEAGDPVSVTGPADGNSIGCRTYHGGAPAGENPGLHCPHAGETGADTCGGWCEVYCGMAMAVCTGGDALYADMTECMSTCGGFDDTADVGATMGDTVQCRLYHLGAAIRTDNAALHCPHAGPTGDGMCVGGWEFRSDEPTAYTRVDRAAMPAVSTVLVVGDTAKEAYNDGDPDGDAAGALVPGLTALHNALVDDLDDASLTICSDPPTGGGTDRDVVPCVSQEVAAGVTVSDLVIPDTISVDLSSAVGFPNGRDLPDPVIDVTLAVILLDLSVHGADTLATLPLNPTENDVDFLSTFPYLAPPHEVP